MGISLGVGVVVEIWAALPDPDHQAGIFPSADRRQEISGSPAVTAKDGSDGFRKTKRVAGKDTTR